MKLPVEVRPSKELDQLIGHSTGTHALAMHEAGHRIEAALVFVGTAIFALAAVVAVINLVPSGSGARR